MNDLQFKLSEAAIKNGSKSFRIASLVLDKKSRNGAYLLYRWCRYCDDIIDKAQSQNEAESALEFLYQNTKIALFENTKLESTSPFYGLRQIANDYNIPHENFLKLLAGFKMDISKYPVRSKQDLDIYCFHVAGIVGLLMCPILDVKDESALKYADSLGRAMQLTNISRDVIEDFNMQRIYIPQDWLDEYSITKVSFLNSDIHDKLFKNVLKLLEWSDQYYIEGRKGIKYLPFRAGLSICIASFLYQGIGNKIRKIGIESFKKRTYLTGFEKIICIIKASFFYLKLGIKYE